jgi:hypothetical protein
MFPTFPHNATFEESHEIQINATPIEAAAEVYTFNIIISLMVL